MSVTADVNHNASGVILEPDIKKISLVRRTSRRRRCGPKAGTNQEGSEEEKTTKTISQLERLTINHELPTKPIQVQEPEKTQETPAQGKIQGESCETTRKTREQIKRLSERQREIIVKTFIPIEQNAVKYGMDMLVKLFSENPQYKNFWPQFRAIPDSSLMNAIELRKHSSVYMRGLGVIIHSMDRENELVDQINRIAKAHIKWNVHRQHVMNMLEPILDTVKECNNEYNAEIKEAWSTLYAIIAELIEIYRNKK